MNEIKYMINDYLNLNMERVIRLGIEICSIPSMTGQEGKKALYVLEKLKESGAKDSYMDKAGNVLFHYNPRNSRNNIVLAAHMDTVFKDIYNIVPIKKGNRIYAPSIKDNSINVAALIFCIRMFMELDIEFNKGLLFVFSVGEEGFGNLRGIRNVVDDWKDVIDEVIAVDGGYHSVVDKAVGSKRYSVEIKTEGGHSWNDFGNTNAIYYAAKIINKIYKIEVPLKYKTTYNVGLINGGTSVNTIAERAEFMLDFRSENMDCLNNLVKSFFELLEGYSQDNKVIFKTKLMGKRPCGRNTRMDKLLGCINEVRDELRLDKSYTTGSTDANIPLSYGIPAVSFGVCNGDGTHTEKEYIELDSLDVGMKHLARILVKLAH